MIRTLLIPGLDGSPAPHWQHWWAATDPTAQIVEQTSWSEPTPEAWLTEIAAATLTHPGSVLVGHSLGAIAIVKLMALWPQVQITGAFLVAPAEPSRCARISDFGPIPERSFGATVVVAASRNDPWMEQSRAQSLARSWGADFIDMENAGHINVASGHGPWAEGKAMRDILWPMRSGSCSQRRPLFRPVTPNRDAHP
ncbi:serine hydrolase family protein [Yangia mangrovi]|uniref:Serine hydrolase family protein n=1 Tax=Alloyangia mangrovi TaxID=1779329 RepID=A0A2A3K0E1_9RHOB|nr:alpha/beta hydrolase [Alloyangia mangrovi]MCT4373150.1 serine hydrolase family protein [Alloyangia mangrovi]